MRLLSLLLLVLTACPAPEQWQPPGDWTVDEVSQPEILTRSLLTPRGLIYLPDSGWLVADQDQGAIFALQDGDATPWLSGLAAPDALVTPTTDSPSIFAMTETDTSTLSVLASDGELLFQTQAALALGAIGLNEQTVWWLDDTELWRGDLTTGAVALVSTDLHDPYALHVTETRVFISDQGNSQIIEVDTATDEATVLTTLDEVPYGLTSEGDSIFVATRSTRWPYGGFIYAIEDGNTTPISYTPPQADRIIRTDTRVVWSSSESLTAAPSEGGDYEMLALQTDVVDLAQTESTLVWTDDSRGLVLRLQLSGSL
jgi:hypothetical protein